MPTVEQVKELIQRHVSPWELMGDPWFKDGEWHYHFGLPFGPLLHGAVTIKPE